MNSVNNLVFLVNPAREIIGDDFVCSMCAVGRHQFATCNPALLMGGNTRVGLEGNFYLEKDARARSSGVPVENNIRIAKEHGLAPVIPGVGRKILGRKEWIA